MPYFIAGILLALIIAISAKVTRFDRDKSFYPTLLIVIASYYILFAFIYGEGIVQELLLATIFLLAAILGGLYIPILTGIGIVAHGVFDLVYPFIINNGGVPLWWPAFCAGIDIPLGIWVIWLSYKGKMDENI